MAEASATAETAHAEESGPQSGDFRNGRRRFAVGGFLLLGFIEAAVGALLGLTTADRRSATDLGEMYRLEPITVKLLGAPPRCLRVTMTLEAPTRRAKAELNKAAPSVTDAIVALVGPRYFEEMNTPDRRQILKKQMMDKINALMQKDNVTHVYFEEFRLEGYCPPKLITDPFTR